MRSYIADLPGGTATTTVQMTVGGTLKTATLAWLNAAAGKIEVSRSSASQIGTAQPTSDVIFRLSVGSAGQSVINVPISETVRPFDYIYIHQTGAGNLGTITLQ